MKITILNKQQHNFSPSLFEEKWKKSSLSRFRFIIIFPRIVNIPFHNHPEVRELRNDLFAATFRASIRPDLVTNTHYHLRKQHSSVHCFITLLLALLFHHLRDGETFDQSYRRLYRTNKSCTLIQRLVITRYCDWSRVLPSRLPQPCGFVVIDNQIISSILLDSLNGK